VPHEVGEGPCRRSLRRREVGGQRWETGSPGPPGRPLPALTTTPPPPAAGPFPPRSAPRDKARKTFHRTATAPLLRPWFGFRLPTLALPRRLPLRPRLGYRLDGWSAVPSSA